MNGAVANVLPIVALTVTTPLGVGMIVNLSPAGITPNALVVLVPAIVTLALLKNSLNGWVALKPFPDIATEVPLGPDVGDNVSLGVTVNVAVGLFVPSDVVIV